MRTDLTINFSQLEDLKARVESYKKAVENLEDSVNNLADLLEEQESEAISNRYHCIILYNGYDRSGETNH